MHKLIEFICEELEDLEKKTDKGKLSMQDMQYADLLAHLKKNLLTSEAMSESESEYSREYSREGSNRGSYRRGRDSMGRYTSRDSSYESSYRGSNSRGKDDLEEQIRGLDEESREMVRGWLKQMR